MEVRYCKYCGEPFLPRKKKQFMCGDWGCYLAHRREKYHEIHPNAVQRSSDVPEQICIICGKAYKPKSRAQKTCGSEECKKENEKQLRELYAYRTKEEERREQAERDARKQAFDKLVREEGWRYGEIQAQKTLAMVEPIKLTLDEPKGDRDDDIDNNGSNTCADSICNRMFSAWVPRGDE